MTNALLRIANAPILPQEGTEVNGCTG